MSSELARLRGALQDLQSHELPVRYRPRPRVDNENDPNADVAGDSGDSDNTSAEKENEIFYDRQLLRRYKNARDSYVQQQTLDLFVDSLAKYDEATNTLPLPGPISDPDREALAQRQREVLESVRGTMARISGGMEGIWTRWDQFVHKREELCQIVEGLERGERKRRIEEEDGDKIKDADLEMREGNEEEITEDDVLVQEEKLDELRKRKSALQVRLRGLRAEILDVEDEVHRTKRAVNEVRLRGGRKVLDWRGLSSAVGAGKNSNGDGKNDISDSNDEEVEYIPTVLGQDVQAEISEMEEKASRLRGSSNFYDSMRELMEELGGIKILSSKGLPTSSYNEESRKDGGEGLAERCNKLEQEEGGFVLTLMLLGTHILDITLTKSSSNADSATRNDHLCVTGAKLTTPTTFPMLETRNTDKNNEETSSLMETMHSISLSNQSFSKILSQKPAIYVSMPPLDDLVTWCQSLHSSSHAIRFIIAETMARLRTCEARIMELRTLRERYAAMVYDVDVTEPSEGGLAAAGKHCGITYEQEVVCAINEGVVCALRLGADCPLIPGSVYVSEMFGVGGWEEVKMEELRRVVTAKRCRGPVEVIECVVEEIRRRTSGGDEGAWAVPSTPCLPRKK